MVVLKCQRRTFKVYSWVSGAGVGTSTHLAVAGPSADEGHRNVRAAPAFDLSAERV